MSAIADIAAAACLVAGGLFALVAGIGVVRLPDVFTRLHASTKAGTLGVGLIVTALALTAGDLRTSSKAIGCIIFLLATAPVGAHLVGRAAAGPNPPVRRSAEVPPGRGVEGGVEGGVDAGDAGG